MMFIHFNMSDQIQVYCSIRPDLRLTHPGGPTHGLSVLLALFLPEADFGFLNIVDV